MSKDEIRGILEKQLKLLSERSKENCDNRDLVSLSHVMGTITMVLLSEY